MTCFVNNGKFEIIVTVKLAATGRVLKTKSFTWGAPADSFFNIFSKNKKYEVAIVTHDGWIEFDPMKP